jgi:nickel/cobalt transporter (NiCoT) family protein
MISCGALVNKTALTIRPCLSSSEAEEDHMAFKMAGLFGGDRGSLRRRIFGIYCLLFLFNSGSWFWAVIVFHGHPLLLGTAFLAYSLGLRHAVDADHIAAIDNVTRKMMQAGSRPVAVGFLFSLGHSTIVLVGAMTIAGMALTLQNRIGAIKTLGSLVGTLVSAVFLFAIGVCNLIVLRSIYRTFAKVRSGGCYQDELCDLALGSRGCLSRIFRPLFRMISRSWHMYPLGVLFGLGFDTATEIGLLGISASEASKGLSCNSILVFPILFAAGMSLIDATDNILMLGAYGWAFVKPIRKLYYNMTITCVSVIVALAVGGIEALGLLAGLLHLRGGFWVMVVRLNESFGELGYAIVGLFALSWAVSMAVYKWRGFDRIEITQQVSIEAER